MAAPVRQSPFLLDERNGRIFPFDPILAKHRAMKPHYKAPVLVKPAAEQAREDVVNYHEPVLPPVEQRPVVAKPNELETQPPEAPAKAEKKPDGRSKAAREARKAQHAQLTAPAQSDIDDIIGDLGGDNGETSE